MKIMIAVPCMDTVPVAFVESLMAMDKPEGTAVCFQPNSLIYDSRNLLALTAIKGEYDYVLWLDSDMIVPKDALTQLLEDALNENAFAKIPMVSGLYVKRAMPTAPVLFDRIDPPYEVNGKLVKAIHEYTDYPRGDLFPIEGCGFGCVLTNVNLLKEVFEKYGPAFAPFPWAGEDASFCYRVKQLRRAMYCDSSVRCGHIGQFVYTDHLLSAHGGDANEKRCVVARYRQAYVAYILRTEE